jgi:hypothetical protein
VEPERPLETVGPSTSRDLGLVDLLAAGLAIGTAAYLVRSSREFWFFYDEWIAGHLAATSSNLLDAYNGHLSVLWLATYRALFEVAGLDSYLPFRLVGILATVGAPVAFYVAFRRRLTPPAAAVLLALLLWYPSISFEPGGFNHSLVLVGAVVVAAHLAVDRPRSDAVVGIALGFCFLSAGGAVAVAVASVVHSALTRARRGRWLAVLIPTAVWSLWWLVEGRSARRVEDPADGLEAIPIVARGVLGSFEGLAFGTTVGGLALLALFVVGLVGRRSIEERATEVGWIVAVLVWWWGLAVTRGDLAQPDTYRYQLTGSMFVLFAATPMLARVARHAALARLGHAAPAAVGVAMAVVVLIGLPDLWRFVDRQAAFGRATRQQAAVADLGGGVIPDGTRFDERLGTLTAAEYRAVTRRFGAWTSGSPDDVDAALVEANNPIVEVTPGGHYPGCRVLEGPFTVAPESRFALHAGDVDVPVWIRRFGRDDTALGVIPARTSALVWVDPLLSDEPWVLRADGACR